MTTNIHYLIAGMAVLLVVIWQYSRQRQMDDRNSRMFRRLLSVVSLDVAAELVSTGFILYAPYSFNVCRMLSNTVFYLFQALLPLLLLYYVCTLCTSRVIAPSVVLRMGIPTIALVCIILTNPFTEMLFYFDGTGYRHGPWYLLLYVSALLHIAGAAVFVAVHRASVSRRNLASLFAVFALAALGIAAQAVNPEVLTTGFGLSLSILAMYLTINNPCACMDSLTGLNDKQYLLRRMDELTDAHKAFHIITVYAYQLDHMNKIAGMRGGDEFLRRAAERMQEIAGRNVFRVTGRRFLLLTFSLREYETCLTRLREPEVRADLLKAVEQHRVERAALPVEDHGDGGVVAVRLFVAAVARQRVIYVRQRDYLRRDRDLLAEQAVRVAAAVPALVMPAADLDGGLEQRLLAVRRQPLEHGRADGGMGTDDVELLGRQAARLVEDVLGNADLADVVQGGGGDDEADLFLGQMVYVGLFDQPAQQHPGHGLHLKHVLGALAVAELDDVAEDADHDIAVPLVAVDLVGDHAHQPLLVGVEPERVLDAALDDVRVERTADVVGNAETVAALNGLAVVGGGDHDDRNLVDPAELVHVLEHGKAVHLRHIDVEQHQIDVHILLEHPERLRAVHCLCVFVSLAQDGLEHFSVHLRVVNDQDFLSVHSRSTAAGWGSLPLSDLVGFSLFYYTTKAMQNKEKLPASATNIIVQPGEIVYTE